MTSRVAFSQPRQIGGLVAVALLQTAATVAVARTIHGAIDGTWPLALLVPLVAAIALAAYALEVIQRRLCDGIGLLHAARVRKTLFDHLLSVRPDIVQRRRQGAMLQSFVGDLTAQRQWVSEGVMRMIVSAITLTGLIAWTAMGSVRIAVAFALVSLLAMLAGWAILRALDRCVQKVRRARGKVSALAAERLATTASIVAFGRRTSETRRLDKRVDKLNALSLQRAWLTGALRGLPHLAGSALLLVVASLHTTLSTGAITAYVMLIGFLTMALRDLARAGELWVSGRISRMRIESLLSLPTVALPAPRKRRKRRKSERERLVFDRITLDRHTAPLSASAPSGTVVVIDGPPELRQKLIWAVGGLLPPLSGAIRWNGADLPGLPPGRRRRILGLCAVDLPIMRGSVAMNLRYRCPRAGAALLAAEASDWGLDPKAAADASDTMALALARAAIGRPPVLLLELNDGLLSDHALNRLRRLLADYPGVVLLMTTRPELRALCGAQWTLSAAGLAVTEAPPASATLALVEDRSGMAKR